MILRLRPEAERDLEAVWDHVADDDPGAADSLIDRLIAAMDRLIALPQMGRERPELGAGIRALSVGQYIIFYRLDGDRLLVARVIHGKRDIRALEVDQTPPLR